MKTVDEILEDVKQLSLRDKEALAELLLCEHEQNDKDCEAEWAREIKRRFEERDCVDENGLKRSRRIIKNIQRPDPDQRRDVYEEVRSLSQEKRRVILEYLVSNLDCREGEEMSDAMKQELDSRIKEMEEGNTVWIPGPLVFADLGGKLGRPTALCPKCGSPDHSREERVKVEADGHKTEDPKYTCHACGHEYDIYEMVEGKYWMEAEEERKQKWTDDSEVFDGEAPSDLSENHDEYLYGPIEGEE